MADKDPIEFLSGPIGRPENPNPEFAANLLDQLLDDLDDGTADTTPPMRLVELTAQPTEPDDQDEGSGATVHLVELTRHPVAPRRPSVNGRILAAAAVVLVLLGGLALLGQRRGDPGPAVTAAEGDPTPAPLGPAAQLGTDFMAARSAHDGAAMQALLADDVTITNDYGIAAPNDYLARAEFERITDTTINNLGCTSLSSERSSCVFTLENSVTRVLGAAPHPGEVVITVSGDRISAVLHAFENNLFFDHMLVFAQWLEENHPEELAVMAGGDLFPVSVTPESAQIIADRTAEFAIATPLPLLKILDEDPRFSTLVQGLTGSDLDFLSGSCFSAPMTVFAPTNRAFEAYLLDTGLGREELLADAGYFEAFFVPEPITFEANQAFGEEPVAVETWAGSRLTVTGGPNPSVNSAPLLADTTDIAACNGVLHATDTIALPTN